MDPDIQKVTANLPAALLKNAMAVTGLGITETLREGLKEIERKAAYREFATLRGKVKLAQTWEELKADRE
jgi:hypothetical protein